MAKRIHLKERVITEEVLIEAMTFMAYIVERHGAVYLPIYERLERELAALQAQGNVLERVRTFAAAHPIKRLATDLSDGSEPPDDTNPYGLSTVSR